MRYVCKNPPGGERNPYQLIDYTVPNIFQSHVNIVTCRRVTHPNADRARRCLTSERSRASQPHH